MVDKRLNKLLLEELSKILNEDTAYHGSPFDFEEFDTKFIGTGEHAQVHGWGLYFALDHNIVKKRYGTRISNNRDDVEEFINYNGKTFKVGTYAHNLLKSIIKKDKDYALSKIEKSLNDKDYISSNKNAIEQLNKLKKIVDNIDETSIKDIKLIIGQNYTVEIPDVKTMLREDNIFLRQPENVKKAIKEIYDEYNKKMNKKQKLTEGASGKDLYYYIGIMVSTYPENENESRKDKLASLELLKHGVPGISYDGYTDGECVVVFSGSDIKILEKEHKKDFDTEFDIPLGKHDIEELTPSEIRAIKEIPEDLQKSLIDYNPSFMQYINNLSPRMIFYALNQDINNYKYVDFKDYTPELVKMVIEDKNDTDILNYCDNMYDKIMTPEVINACFEASTNLNFLNLIFGNNRSYPFMEKYIYKPETVDKILEINNLKKKIAMKNTGKHFFKDIIVGKFGDLPTETYDKIYNMFGDKMLFIPSEIKNMTAIFKRCSDDLKERKILQYPQYAMLVDNISETTQKALIKKNPYNIKYIKNPSKSILNMVKNNVNIKDYIRKV